MSEFKLIKDPQSGKSLFWEPGQEGWAEVEARRNSQTGEIAIFHPDANSWRELGAPKRPPEGPFDGEGFGALAKRRGQQFARGAMEVAASVPEAAAVAGFGNPNTSALFASEVVQKAQAQIRDAEMRLAEQPDMPEEQRARIQAVIDQERKSIEAYQPVVDIAEGPLKPDAQDRALFKRGDAMRQAGADVFGTADPRDTSFWSKVAEGAGNMTGLVAMSAMAGPAAIGAGAALGSSLNSASLYKEAKEAGADEETATRAASFGAAVGATEIVPISRALKLLPPRMRKKVGGKFFKHLIDIAQASGEEAAQEYLATVANNIIAQNLYDTERGWTDGATEAALVGAVLGGAIGAVGTAFSKDNATSEEEPSQTAPKEVAQNAPQMPTATPPEQSPTPALPQASEPDARPEPIDPPAPIEVMDEVETIDGESVLTGRKVRVNQATGKATIVEDADQVASAPTDVRPNTESPAAPLPPEPDVPPELPRERNESKIQFETLSSEQVADIGFEPDVFQYKGNADEKGVTDRLQGVTDWDERSATGGIVFEYADGRRSVGDGHQRLGLAQRLQSSGKQTPWHVEIIREKDGYTPQDVRRIAALKNIREGSGTAIDAAKVLREKPEEIDKLNLPYESRRQIGPGKRPDNLVVAE